MYVNKMEELTNVCFGERIKGKRREYWQIG